MSVLITSFLPYLSDQLMAQPRFIKLLAHHGGQSIKLQYLNYHICFTLHQSGLLYTTNDQVDTHIHMNFEALLASIGIKHNDAKIDISGNYALGQQFSQCLLQLKLDPKHFLYDCLPPTLALFCAEALSFNHYIGKRILTTLKDQLHHYLIYEAGYAAHREAIDHQYQDILKLKWDIDALNQK